MGDSRISADKVDGMVVVYDGECPFCSNYVRLMALKKKVGAVELVDARSGDARVRELWKRGYDLNEGMAVLYGDAVYYGSDALALISAVTGEQGPAQKLLSMLLRSPRRARLLYPAMKAGRRVTLRMLGRSDIVPALD